MTTVAGSISKTARTLNDLQFVTGIDSDDETVPTIVSRQIIVHSHWSACVVLLLPLISRWLLCFLSLFVFPTGISAQTSSTVTLNHTANGYRGIWYMNQPSGDEYVYKYSGGLGTYCAKHRPFAIYCKEVDRTFFCYGGTPPDSNRRLLHMVSYFDHATGTVPRPTILLDKQTSDAHDNPVISVDSSGHLWIFSTSHGRERPSYVHRSVRPWDIREFKQIPATYRDNAQTRLLDNFSYMQVWHSAAGFHAFFTRYADPAARTVCFMKSDDGQQWSEWQRIAGIQQGHYQISGQGQSVLGTMFNYHPNRKGLNWRTNLYYVQTTDNGASWKTADGTDLTLPLTKPENPALVVDAETDRRNVYLKDLQFDRHDHPVLLYITSGGYESGPANDPRTWTLTRWMGQQWQTSVIGTSDNNYDFGELWMVDHDDWRLIAPTETGPQPYNPGGEVVMWQSHDEGQNWQQVRNLTRGSSRNHTYVRRVLNAHPDFVAFWADGHGRQPSESDLYFSDVRGTVYRLPRVMKGAAVTPQVVSPPGYTP